MKEQEKNRQRKKILKKIFLSKRGSGVLNKKRKESFLTSPATVIKKDPTMSIRKYINEMKVHEETVRTAIKEDLNPDLKPLNYALWGVLENKTNATSNQILVRLKQLLRINGIKCLNILL